MALLSSIFNIFTSPATVPNVACYLSPPTLPYSQMEDRRMLQGEKYLI